jgi:peptidyl-prolyl cis-trans isomerase SurA
VAQDAAPAAIADASKRAQDIVASARKSENFAQLAVTLSASQTALEGGALGWRKGPELPTFLADIVAQLKPGEVSEVLQTATGFHIVRLNDKRSTTGSQIIQQVHLRHILIKTNEVMDDATVRQKLGKMRERILGGDFAVLAKTSSEDRPASTAATWAGRSSAHHIGNFGPSRQAQGQRDQPASSRPSMAGIAQMLGRRQFDNTKPPRASRPTRRCDAVSTATFGCSRRDGAYVKSAPRR